MGFFESIDRTSRIVKLLFHEVLGEDEVAKSLLRVADNVERHQEYLWKYIDYGIRTPIFRNMQWIWYGPEFKKGETERTSGQIKRLLLEINTHLLKEYFQTWFTLLDSLKTKERRLESTLKRLAEETGIKYGEGELGELKSGISAELKACYVLIDHGKPFLPFSIMQAPVVPSVIRLTASGDLYLFEENLVVDVKSGWLEEAESIGKLPTYYYHGRKRGLGKDLEKCGNLKGLYGIRKGIGVLAEEDEILYFAIYVPWRHWRVEGPLLHLTSARLPFLVYMHRVNFETYRGSVRDGFFVVELEALVLSDSEDQWITGSKWALQVYNFEDTTKGGARLRRKEVRGRIEFKRKEGNCYYISIEIPTTSKDIIEYQGKKYLALNLVHSEKQLKIPILVTVEEG